MFAWVWILYVEDKVDLQHSINSSHQTSHNGHSMTFHDKDHLCDVVTAAEHQYDKALYSLIVLMCR